MPAHQLYFWTLALLTPIALAVAGRLRLHDGRLVRGPRRLDAGEPAGPYLLVMLAGLLAWASVPQLFLSLSGGSAAAPASTSPPTTSVAGLPGHEKVLLALLAGLVPLLVMLGLHLARGPASLARLGLSRGHLAAAALPALLGALVVLPLMQWVAVGLMELYVRLGVQHPLKHELLQVLERTTDWPTRLTMVAGATVVAPLFEELLFRGHLQTLLAEGFGHARMSLGGASSPAGPSPAARWAAILAASALFAAVHEPWSWPAIFALSVAMGYAYERTGNLYVPILLHVAFNAASILIFLFVQAPPA